MCLTLFVAGHCEVTLLRSARCLARAKGQLPPATLCRPTSGVWQGDSRALLTLPGKETLLWSLCRNPHDTVWVLGGVSATALQTGTVSGTLVRSRLPLFRK